MSELLNLAKQAALLASKEIKKHYDNFKCYLKDDNSPLTSADLAANEAIFKILSKSNIPICSEEQILDETTRLKSKKFWLVDPLDGTKEFISKNGEFCVCVALIEDSTPTIGVIMIPMSNELFYADSSGAFREILDENGNILSKSKLSNLPKNGVKNIYIGNKGKALKEHEIATKFSLNVVRLGSAIKFCRLAQNSGIYVRFSNSSLWDIAAGEAILKFSNAIMLRADNFLEISYNTRELSSPKFVAIGSENLHLKDKILTAICKIQNRT